MAILNNSNAISSGGYDINNSLRFRSSASAYLNRTPGSASNRKTWTWSAWVKKAQIQGGASSTLSLFSCTTGANDSTFLRFGFYQDKFYVGNNSAFFLQSTPLYRDPSAWYHVVVSTDTTQGTASNRMRVYINGTEITAWGTDQRATYLTSSVDLGINQATQHSIGSSLPNVGEYFDGYMTDINFIDGQALTPSSFGSTNSTTGVWQPAKYTGTYGTNGFYLTFADTSALTTSSNAGLGKDTSGNGNYWATNNISITAGTTYDAMTDVPTNTSATVANYAVLNPVYKSSSQPTISNGNLTVAPSAASYQNSFSTIGITSGKFYAEITITGTPNSANIWGMSNAAQVNAMTTTSGIIGDAIGGIGYGYYYNGSKYSNGTLTAYGASLASGDVVGIAYDADGGSLTFYKNGTSQGVAYTGIDASTVWFFGATSYTGGSTSYNFNFGQRPFSFSPPSGYIALNTYNLPTPTILQGNLYMDATLYTQNGAATNVVVNQAQFKPDLVWLKCRSTAGTWNVLVDSVRGVSSTLATNSTAAQDTYPVFSSFNSNGFTLPLGDSGTNSTAGRTQVAWQWQAGQGSSSSNTSGSITSTVSVNTTAGFSIATFSGASSGTVGHGLGVAPKMIILKTRTTVLGWYIYHVTIGANGWIQFDTSAAVTGNSAVFGNVTPTSTVFTYSGGLAGTGNYVAYCWAEIAGFSKFGSYTGNGSADGPFIFTGFRPKFIMRKQSSAVGDWIIFDNSRDTFNVETRRLLANSSNAEATPGNDIDILSNGWKERSSDGYSNASGQTYIYMAFAEVPTKFANAR